MTTQPGATSPRKWEVNIKTSHSSIVVKMGEHRGRELAQVGDSGGEAKYHLSRLNESLYFINFIRLHPEELSIVRDTMNVAISTEGGPPMVPKWFGWGNGAESKFASVDKVQQAINDPNMVLTVVIGHAAFSGKLWESPPDHHGRGGRSICPAGFQDPRFPCTHALSPRNPAYPKPGAVWLLGCHIGALHEAWAKTFNVDPRKLHATQGYSAADDPCIKRGTCEDSKQQLLNVLGWVERHRFR